MSCRACHRCACFNGLIRTSSHAQPPRNTARLKCATCTAVKSSAKRCVHQSFNSPHTRRSFPSLCLPHASFRSTYGRSAAWLISSHSTATHSPMAARLPPSPANTRYRPHTVARSRCTSCSISRLFCRHRFSLRVSSHSHLQLIDVVAACLVLNPSERPSSKDVLRCVSCVCNLQLSATSWSFFISAPDFCA